jgi:hypothetical protein
LIYIKSQIDKKINALVSMPAGRSDFSRQQLELIDSHLTKSLQKLARILKMGRIKSLITHLHLTRQRKAINAK